MLEQPDKQISLTDPDARSMATSGRGSGMVGYNVQAAVEGEHHLIDEKNEVIHDSGSGRTRCTHSGLQALIFRELHPMTTPSGVLYGLISALSAEPISP